ncbi:MAG TPA: hypothetical protein VFF81_11305 [Noviherbaspirillum sp.]|nr:hypothetical protein [Noviherbaspirillum sp.]
MEKKEKDATSGESAIFLPPALAATIHHELRFLLTSNTRRDAQEDQSAGFFPGMKLPSTSSPPPRQTVPQALRTIRIVSLS